jgi:histidinol-phosphate/aromatic aminotransferase/cobyric acid decarboxylase-like protein
VQSPVLNENCFLQMEVSEFFKKLAPYAPVQPPSALAAKAGLEEEQLVKLDANENPFGSPLFVKEALEKGFPLFHIYPGRRFFFFFFFFFSKLDSRS